MARKIGGCCGCPAAPVADRREAEPPEVPPARAWRSRVVLGVALMLDSRVPGLRPFTPRSVHWTLRRSADRPSPLAALALKGFVRLDDAAETVGADALED